MNKIITIGREFGSGGRELGARLAGVLGVAYYDGEIVSAIAQRSELAESYVNQVLEKRIRAYYPITVANTLSIHNGDAVYAVTRSIYTAQTEILREIAEKSDCVIVGRCAGYILADYHPIRIFVYADMQARIARCRERHKAENNGEDISDKALEKRIREVDRERAQYYRFYTGQTWGDRSNYDICVNTTHIPIPKLAELIGAIRKVDPPPGLLDGPAAGAK